jgi:multisubunit Na+/H+ antiporter MnhG subunit
LKESNKSRGRRSLFRYIRDARQPELPVVLLEDTGALVGLVFALIGVGMATLTGDGRWDGLGAMAVGTLLVVIAVFLAFEMSSMLVGESALPEQDAAIRKALEDTEEVDRVIHLKTLHVGPDELLVAAKIAIGGEDDAALDRARGSIRPKRRCAPWCPPPATSIWSPTSTVPRHRLRWTDPARLAHWCA